MTDAKFPCVVCGVVRTTSAASALTPCINCARWASVFLDPIGPWAKEAACAEVDPELWFPKYVGIGSRQELMAKRVCGTCEVRTQCLDHALKAKEPHGIWGGLNPVERRKLRKGSAA